jgi:2-polyprenyl-3-methyl-5-hydroxy-6-metoxy-1,4-benzoquinol methylase
MKFEKYAKQTHFYSQKIPLLLKKYLSEKNTKSYMDLGCGDGALLFEMLNSNFLKNKKIYAVDLSEKRLEKIKKLKSDITCIQNDACNLKDIQNSEIDFITSSQVIEHVSDDEKMIKEMHRILKENGTIYLSTVFKKKFAWYFYRCNGKWTLDPTHVREYTNETQLFSIINNNNFQIIETKKSFIWFTPIHFILRLFKTKNDIHKHTVIRLLQKIKIPIPRYRNWELILKKSK